MKEVFAIAHIKRGNKVTNNIMQAKLNSLVVYSFYYWILIYEFIV